MSYCRTGNNCDVYVWSDGRKYETAVAHARGGLGKPLVEIGLPYDSAHFVNTTLRGLLQTLSMLRNSGYRIPEPVFKRVRRELRHEPSNAKENGYVV